MCVFACAEALLDAYLTHNNLRMLARIKLDESLESIAGACPCAAPYRTRQARPPASRVYLLPTSRTPVLRAA